MINEEDNEDISWIQVGIFYNSHELKGKSDIWSSFQQMLQSYYYIPRAETITTVHRTVVLLIGKFWQEYM